MENKIIKNAGVHHIAIAASDFEKSIKFYTEGLGFSRAACWGEGDKRAALLDIGDGNYIELFANGKKEAQSCEKIIHIAFSVGSADDAFDAAVKAGANPRVAPKDADIPSSPPMRVRIAFVGGPDGETLEFFQTREQ